MHDGGRRVVAAAGASAQAIGIMPGMPLANAQALVPGLGIVESEPDADAGVEAMRLIATTAEPLEFAQIDAMPQHERTNTQELAGLMDRLINRFGVENVYRIAPIESDVPEAIGTARATIGGPERDVLAGHPTAADTPFDAAAAGDGDRTAA